ncbi:hypothetical protein [Caldivirga maquilingensis]|uniref:Uncharacterized protein n=1 Tax=Caldivirga maquilingensis (strain ATCC 700844 / DSM 13496 / JCM 10307 / IC-167) TaxID=397948 RepID=A8MB86_CALMQ|nr:hypothetical protein [Caldivirga maquilingensis]ABW01176.1 hypothetical protein Cmaq_0330 [Caldivirga maquilingensis IC-167]
MPGRVRSVLLNITVDVLMLLILYSLLSLLGYSISLTGLILVVVAIAAAGVRSIVKGTEHSIFAVTASLVEGLALLSLFTMGTRPTSVGGMVAVSSSLILDYVLALSIILYLVYTMIDDALTTD